MRKRHLYSLLIFITGTILSVVSMAQSGSHYKASLAQVNAGNFYKIILPPQIIAKCQTGLADIRIKDQKGEQVPYIVKTDLPVFNESSFVNFPILSNRKETDKQTHIVIQNASSTAINSLLLMVKNTEAKRSVTLSGSDDQQQWFVIKENIYLDNYVSNEEGSFIQTLSFPASSYKYFQVTILGQNLLPVNIIKAGISSQNFIDGKYADLPAPLIRQTDSSDKHSYAHLILDDNYQVDQLELSFAGAKYFRRTIKLYPADLLNKEPVWYEINSGSPAILPVQFHNKEIIAEVYNEDNPPLKIINVKARQLNQYLLAYLDKGKEYNVFFGDSAAAAPKYDLEFFKDSIGKNPSELTVGKIELLTKPVVVQKRPTSIFNTVILWIVIGLVLLLLLIITLRMTREVNKRSQN